jgi:hypothetical protein
VTEPATAEPATPPPASAAAPPKLSRRRRIVVWTLIVLASLIALVATLTTWVNRQMLNNAAWNRASVQIIQDPVVQSALATNLVNQLYENVNVAAELERRLPSSLKQLAAPAAAALQEPVTKSVQFLLGQPRFQQLFVRASDVAHQKLVNVLENKTGYGISTGNGVVTLDMSELLHELGAELGVPADALARLPANAGVVTVMKSDQLSAAQSGVRAVKVLSVWLLVLVFVLYGLAIYLAPGRRRKTLSHCGWGLVIVGLLVLVARRLLGNYVINGLTQPQNRMPVNHIWLYATEILGQVGYATIFYGLVAVLGAFIAGPTRLATALRRWAAPTLNTRPELTWGAAAFLLLLLVLWGPTHAMRTWWGILVFAALLALGVVVLRRETRAEFPQAGLEAGGESLGARIAATASGAAHRVSGAVHHEAEADPRSPAEELSRLAELRDKGAISEAEYEQAKKLALEP